MLSSVGAVVLLFVRSAKATVRDGVSLRAVLVQAAELGSRSAWLVLTGMGFFGTVLVTIAYAQARKYTGNITIVGPAYFELMVREFAPLTVGLLVASRAGAGTGAELAAMNVNEQLEALELSAADPLSELVTPRVLGSVLTLPALCCIGTLAAALAAAGTVQFVFHADGMSFLDPRFLDAPDILCAFVKSVLCGLYIPLAASSRGLKAQGGAAAVGDAVTSGVVDASMGCLVIDFLVASAFLLSRL